MGELVTIKTYINRPSAEGAKLALEARGIRADISADDAGGMFPGMGKGVHILVEKEDAQKAMETLRSLEEQAKGTRDTSSTQSQGFLSKLFRWLKGS